MLIMMVLLPLTAKISKKIAYNDFYAIKFMFSFSLRISFFA